MESQENPLRAGAGLSIGIAVGRRFFWLSIWTLPIIVLLAFITAAYAEQRGIASVYSARTNKGATTASGRPFRNDKLTAAHRSLPFGTRVRVTNRRNKKMVIVVITDRGPYIRGRIIDLTMAAAREIGLGYSTVPVIVERLQ